MHVHGKSKDYNRNNTQRESFYELHDQFNHIKKTTKTSISKNTL